MRSPAVTSALTLILAACGPAPAQTAETAKTAAAGETVTPNMGAVTGSGALADRQDKPIGAWSVSAVLEAGHFTGDGSVTVNGVTVKMPLKPETSYLENGKCYFEMEQGRSHIRIGGPCTARSVSGTMSGFITEGEIYSINGAMSGTLAFATPTTPGGAVSSGVLPTKKLTCAWMERIGGILPGQDYHYELRFSNMVTLTLAPNGTYKTNSTSGRFVRGPGDTIRLTSGQFAGAVGHLQPDKSGAPAVYFERDENKNPKGVHIVDPQRTSCTVARDG